jgi:hypothetical protein
MQTKSEPLYFLLYNCRKKATSFTHSFFAGNIANEQQGNPAVPVNNMWLILY